MSYKVPLIVHLSKEVRVLSTRDVSNIVLQYEEDITNTSAPARGTPAFNQELKRLELDIGLPSPSSMCGSIINARHFKLVL